MFEYFDVIRSILNEVEASEGPALDRAAREIADRIASGKVLHFFAAGHSYMLGEELFYRAGGLAPVNVLFDPALMPHNGATKSSRLERLHGYSDVILDDAGLGKGDVMIVASTSGVNPVPVEMAQGARARGVFVIGLTSVAGSRATPLRGPGGQRLCDVADVVLDTHVPCGDAAVEVPGLDQRIAPVSTVIGASILNEVVVRVVRNLLDRGIAPPVFRSSNLPGGAEHNTELIDTYRARIRRF
ncbi:MAG: SIS domain-containing protein [Firmicutes bacterium]|nr:SIS domain-containing protein [Bacillota bacterium]